MKNNKNKDDKAYDLRLIFEQMELDLIKKLKQAFFFHKREEQKEGFQFEQWQLAKLRAMEKWRKLNKKLIGSRKKPVEDLVQKTLEESYTKGEERVVQAYENAKNKVELKGKAIIPEDTISKEVEKAKEVEETVKEQQGMKDIAPNKVVDKKVELPRTPRNNEELPKADPEESFFGVNEKKLNALIDSVTNDLNKAQTSIQRLMDDIYRQTIFKTHMYLQNGVLTLNQAVDKATKDFLDKGINSITYKDGKRVNIASYVEMCLRTASQRATFLGEGKKRDEFGIHLVVVTAHANTCPKCAPWQGKVLIDDVFSHPSKEYIEEYSKKYKLLSEAIKAGFMHPNCRHTITTFFEGITQIPEIPDTDKAMETYMAEQKQRAHERVIRKQKRISEGSCDETNKEEADRKVRLHQKGIRDILKEHPELRRNAEREKYIKIKKNNVSKSRESDIIKERSNRPITKITVNAISNVPNANIPGYTKTESKKIQKHHQELLKFSRDNNDNKEVAFVFKDNIFEGRKEFLGSDDALDFGVDLNGNDLFVMHNHPRNSSYSDTDIVFFLSHDNVKTLSIVKNNGGVEILIKGINFNADIMKKEYNRLYKKIVKTNTHEEKEKFVKTLLTKSKSGVIWYE